MKCRSATVAAASDQPWIAVGGVQAARLARIAVPSGHRGRSGSSDSERIGDPAVASGAQGRRAEEVVDPRRRPEGCKPRTVRGQAAGPKKAQRIELAVAR